MGNRRANARFRVLELLKNNFGPGDKLVATSGAPQYVYAQASSRAMGSTSCC